MRNIKEKVLEYCPECDEVVDSEFTDWCPTCKVHCVVEEKFVRLAEVGKVIEDWIKNERGEDYWTKNDDEGDFVHYWDIKEFIRRLKEECNKFECYDFKENIDKLSGKELSK